MRNAGEGASEKSMSDNRLTKLLKGALSEYDFGVLEHGFAPHSRDHRFLIQDSLCNDPTTLEDMN
jgi:hypothetical protein